MEIVLLCVGKTDRSGWTVAFEEYQKRIQHYVKYSLEVVKPEKGSTKTPISQVKLQEENRLLSRIKTDDTVILLDEKGALFTSTAFAHFMQKQMNKGAKRLVFVVGGPFGFSPSFLSKFPLHVSLSNLTFSHQMVRLLFSEQVYRAFTILNNHPYHNT